MVVLQTVVAEGVLGLGWTIYYWHGEGSGAEEKGMSTRAPRTPSRLESAVQMSFTNVLIYVLRWLLLEFVRLSHFSPFRPGFLCPPLRLIPNTGVYLG